MNRFKITLLLIFIIHLKLFSQLNPLTNCYSSEHNAILSAARTLNNYNDHNSLTGIQCDSNSFFALRGDSVDKYSLIGNTILYNGVVLTGVPGQSLSINNNLNGNIYSPTFYTSDINSSFHPCSFYNGINWTIIPTNYSSNLVNNGGYNNFLYFMAGVPNIFQEQIVRYNGVSFYPIYGNPNWGPTVGIADLAVDNSGNVWFLTTSNTTSFITDSLVVISSSGQLVKQIPFSYNCYNAYGSFLLNNTYYIGLGSGNALHPNTLIPVTIVADSAIVGIPINMPAYSYLDLASCNPGASLSIDIKNTSFMWNLFPNPFQGVITISIKKQNFKYISITIKNILGQTIFIEEEKNSDNNYSKAIDLSFLTNGIYLLELNIDKERTVKKIVKE